MLAQSSAMESCWYSRFLYWDKTAAATQHVGAQAVGRVLPAHLLRSSYPHVCSMVLTISHIILLVVIYCQMLTVSFIMR